MRLAWIRSGNILGLYRENGKENGNYRDYRDYRDYIGYSILGLYRENGKENGNYNMNIIYRGGSGNVKVFFARLAFFALPDIRGCEGSSMYSTLHSQTLTG